MNIDVIAYAVIGGLIPDAIRILKWSRKPKSRRGANPSRLVRRNSITLARLPCRAAPSTQ